MQHTWQSNRIGLLDTPAEIDQLGVESHIQGLVRFVQQCETPMTVAIQGGWGAGKTSVMKMLASEAQKDPSVHVVNFNTWQYAQFELGDQLATSLLLRIIAGLPDTTENEPRKVKLFKMAQRLVAGAAAVTSPMAVTLGNSIFPGVGDSLRELAGKVAQREQELELSPVEAIEHLREEFAELVRTSGKRVLVFVDDLDRLEPQKAVELMEAIKLFLDVKHCVFVLAIDFDVVKRGVKAKYRSDFSDRKARSFFEKIIQVPFQLPTHLYDIEPLLKQGLGGSVASIGTYVELAQESIGNNPRATKRLVNTFALLKQVQQGEIEVERDVDIFASLCLQNAYPSIAEHINLSLGSDAVNDILPAADGEDEGDGSSGEEAAPENLRLDSKEEEAEWKSEWTRATPFLKHLRQHFSTDGTFDEGRFRSATEVTQATSAGDAPAAPAGETAAGAWNLTTEPAEMRERLAGKTPDAVIDWAMEFRAQVDDVVELVGQQSAQWTLRRCDRSVKNRFGLLSFNQRTVVLNIDKFDGDRDSEAVERVLKSFRSALVRDPEAHFPSVSLRGREGTLPLRVQWKVDDPIDVAELARLIKGLFG